MGAGRGGEAIYGGDRSLRARIPSGCIPGRSGRDLRGTPSAGATAAGGSGRGIAGNERKSPPYLARSCCGGGHASAADDERAAPAPERPADNPFRAGWRGQDHAAGVLCLRLRERRRERPLHFFAAGDAGPGSPGRTGPGRRDRSTRVCRDRSHRPAGPGAPGAGRPAHRAGRANPAAAESGCRRSPLTPGRLGRTPGRGPAGRRRLAGHFAGTASNDPGHCGDRTGGICTPAGVALYGQWPDTVAGAPGKSGGRAMGRPLRPALSAAGRPLLGARTIGPGHDPAPVAVGGGGGWRTGKVACVARRQPGPLPAGTGPGAGYGGQGSSLDRRNTRRGPDAAAGSDARPLAKVGLPAATG